ncbi:unnamed protein product [Closterium sp. Naga37s-1]|nr:unnamed protein product [Closterium sp. Naga37s-1]
MAADHHGPSMNPSPGDGSGRSSSSSLSPAAELSPSLRSSPPFHGCSTATRSSPSTTQYDSLLGYHSYVAGNVDAGVTSPSTHNGYAEAASHFRRKETSPASASHGNSQSLAPESEFYAYPAPPQPPASLSPSFSLPTYASYTSSHPTSSICGPTAALPASLASRSPSATSATSFPSSLSHPSVSSSSDGEDLGPSACPFQASLVPAYAPFSASTNGTVNAGVNGSVNAAVNGGVNPMSPLASFPARPANAPLERTSSGPSGLRGGHGAGGSGGTFPGVAEAAGAGIFPERAPGGGLLAVAAPRSPSQCSFSPVPAPPPPQSPNGHQVADYLLSQLLHLTRSSAGCISSALRRPRPRSNNSTSRDSNCSNSKNSGGGGSEEEEESLFLRTHSITNFAWTPYLKAWYAENAASGLVFGNMKTLMGQVVTTADVIVSNDVASDPRSTGVPPGHPPMTTFLGVPLFSGSRLVGMFAVTNREGGYSRTLVTELHALTKTVGQVVAGIQQRRQRWEREERLNAVLEGACQAVLSVAPSGRLSCINRAARSLFGVPDQAMGPHSSSSSQAAAGAGGAAVGTGATSSLSHLLASLSESDLSLSDLIESIDGDAGFMQQGVLLRYAESEGSFPAVGLSHGDQYKNQLRSSQGRTDRDMSAAAVRMNLRVRVTRGETSQVAYVLTVQPAEEVELGEREFHLQSQTQSDGHHTYHHMACGRAERNWRGAAADSVGGGDGEGEEDGHECQLLMSDEDGTLTIVV